MSMNIAKTAPVTTARAPKEMSLDQFMKEAGSEDVKKIFNRINTGSFTACHTAFFESTGIWIPELVPVFKKLDAMLVMGGEIHPQGLPK